MESSVPSAASESKRGVIACPPTVPTNPYGATKLAVDMAIGSEAAAAAARGQTFGATSLRYFLGCAICRFCV